MKVLLAYSGGLDTSCAIVWLKEIRKVSSVKALLVDVGQNDDFEALAKRALKLGADEVEIVNAKIELAQFGIVNMLRAGATFEGCYLLGTAIARPFIADAVVRAANDFGADAFCHGATGKGNDYLRFEGRVLSKAPHLKIISPWREWECNDRDSAFGLLAKSGIEFAKKSFDFSVDSNLWHTSYEGGSLENLSTPPPEVLLEKMEKTGIVKVNIGWKNGCPVSLDGRDKTPLEIIQSLNTMLEPTGYGWLDMIETRTNGIKSRGIYHTPAGTLLYFARRALISAMFPGPTLAWMNEAAQNYGVMLYEGQWEHPLMKAIDAGMASLFEGTTGNITLSVSGSQVVVCSRNISSGCFDSHLGGFGSMNTWNNSWSESLVHLQQLKWHSKTFQTGAK